MQHKLNIAVHRYRVLTDKNELQGMYTNLPCAQDTIRCRPERFTLGYGWYVVDYITGKKFERGQLE